MLAQFAKLGNEELFVTAADMSVVAAMGIADRQFSIRQRSFSAAKQGFRLSAFVVEIA